MPTYRVIVLNSSIIIQDDETNSVISTQTVHLDDNENIEDILGIVDDQVYFIVTKVFIDTRRLHIWSYDVNNRTSKLILKLPSYYIDSHCTFQTGFLLVLDHGLDINSDTKPDTTICYFSVQHKLISNLGLFNMKFKNNWNIRCTPHCIASIGSTIYCLRNPHSHAMTVHSWDIFTKDWVNLSKMNVDQIGPIGVVSDDVQYLYIAFGSKLIRWNCVNQEFDELSDANTDINQIVYNYNGSIYVQIQDKLAKYTISTKEWAILGMMDCDSMMCIAT